MGERWCDGPIIGFDTETTGVDPETARLVSAAIVLDDIAGKRRWELEYLINPGVEIPLEATSVHGISTEEAIQYGLSACDGVTRILKALDTIREHYGPLPVVIYNAPYDLTILDREMGRHLGTELQVSFPVIDPLICDRILDKYRSGRRTLTAVSAAYNVGIAGAHTATGDVVCSLKLARAIARRYPHFGDANVDYLQAYQRTAYKEWAEHFTEFKRKHDPAFAPIPKAWPMCPRVERVNAV
jgi:DNA polymerase-3 subunit epsilon